MSVILGNRIAKGSLDDDIVLEVNTVNWIEDRLRIILLLNLGATLPLIGLASLGILGAGLVSPSHPVLRWVALPVAALLLVNLAVGVGLALKTFPPPPGRRIAPGEAPELEASLGRALAEWRGPRGASVLLAPDAWTLELSGVPVAGMLGWNRYHWSVGIYPLLVLGRDEFQVLAAWEAAFWSDQQGWLNLQAKRLCIYWYRLHLHLAARVRKGGRAPAAWGVVLLRPFAAWMVARAQPFLAREFLRVDQAIATSHGASTLGRALCRLAVLEPLAARRGFAAWSASIEAGHPLPDDLYRDLAARLACPGDMEALLELALDGLQREAPPLLRFRLECLGVRPNVPPPPGEVAFTSLLEGTRVLEEVHRVWMSRMKEGIEASARERRAGQERFWQLSADLEGIFPDHPDSQELLALAFHHAPWDEFDLLLRMFRQVRPGSVRAGFLAVRRALQRGLDAAALHEARRLLVRDPLLAPVCHEAIARHLRERGEAAGADEAWNRALRSAAAAERMRREVKEASLEDDLEPGRWDPEVLAGIRAFCGATDGVGAAWLFRKRTPAAKVLPVMVLVVDGGMAAWSARRRRDLRRRLAASCPRLEGVALVVRVAGPLARWRWKDKLDGEGALIFRRRSPRGWPGRRKDPAGSPRP
jgi:hypothetical protein